jgi:multisubunit Na+/H+ antiporter MnhE subunit
MRAMIVAVALLAGGWLVLSRDLEVTSVCAGVVAAAAAMALQRRLFPQTRPPASRILRHPLRLLFFACSLGLRLAHSTLYTCRLILTGHEEGEIVAVPTSILDPLAQFLLSHSITLTPSTIALIQEDDLLYIHWLKAPGAPGDWRRIKETLETHLSRLFPEGPRGDR